MNVAYSPFFIKKFKKLPTRLQDEVMERIELYKNDSKNTSLKVHSLHGKFQGSYSFSVNYAYRIIFEYVKKSEIVLLDIGDHDIYK